MRKHFLYLKYVVRHKWFVAVACWRCGAPMWNAIIHDWHKFLPSEWFAYVEYFYGDWRKLKDTEPDDFRYWSVKGPIDAAFDHAWNKHQKRGKHHWQYWLLTLDEGTTKPLQMPEKYVREMVADWWGAGRAITGIWNALEWFNKNESKMQLFPMTKALVFQVLMESAPRFINELQIPTTVGYKKYG